jgi:catechol 2,3-dioxygenase
MPYHRLQKVTLRVPKLEPARQFYHDVVGLELLSEADNESMLGTGEEPLVTLVESPQARARDNEAGLFHVAILFPDRQSLADALNRLRDADHTLTGAADHAVSEALYTDDPAGNGVELYCDRPESSWARDESGEVYMTTERLDVADLQRQASTATPSVAPHQTRLGHVHLEVTDLERTLPFYRDVLGMDLQTTNPGAKFVSWNGYHHHVAFNTWKHRRGPHDPETLGLTSVTAALSKETIADIHTRAGNRDLVVETDDEHLELTDPDGITWHLRPR